MAATPEGFLDQAQLQGCWTMVEEEGLGVEVASEETQLPAPAWPARVAQPYSDTTGQSGWRLDPYHLEVPAPPMGPPPATTPMPPPPPPPPPMGPPPMAVEAYVEQRRLHREVVRRLGGADIEGGFDQYIATYGRIDRVNAPYGDRVWQGLMETYRTQYARSRAGWYLSQEVSLNVDNVFFGWFECPQPFNRDQAAEPLEADTVVAPRVHYPAIFIMTSEDGLWLWMACEAILFLRSRMWLVHRGRATLLGEDVQIWIRAHMPL